MLTDVLKNSKLSTSILTMTSCCNGLNGWDILYSRANIRGPLNVVKKIILSQLD